MKKLPLILLFFFLIFVYTSAQTKKPRKPVVKSVKTPTPAKIVKTPTPPPPPMPITSPTPAPAPAQTIVLNKFESEILAELNLLRRNPADYAKIVEEYLKTYDGKYFLKDDGVRLETREGKIPVEELIITLKSTAPLPEFKAADGMIKAAVDHIQDLVKNNKTGHYGTNGSVPEDRVNRYGRVPSGVNENISYRTGTARGVVLTMLIDDGNKTRPHRRNLLDSQIKFIGLATGEIKQVGMSCVIVFANSFADR